MRKSNRHRQPSDTGKVLRGPRCRASRGVRKEPPKTPPTASSGAPHVVVSRAAVRTLPRIVVAGLLGLGCTVAPRAGETAAEGEAGARAAVVHGGYAYLCDNPAEYPGYDPAKLWDEGLRALGFAAARLRSGDVGDWGGRIGQYDLILLTNMYAHSTDVR